MEVPQVYRKVLAAHEPKSCKLSIDRHLRDYGQGYTLLLDLQWELSQAEFYAAVVVFCFPFTY